MPGKHWGSRPSSWLLQCLEISRVPMTVTRTHRKTRVTSNVITPTKLQPRNLLSKRRVRVSTIVDRITTSLEEDIVLGRRHPRERLIEQDLCDRFKTHRADVRLAFFELEKMGIIQRIPNRG